MLAIQVELKKQISYATLVAEGIEDPELKRKLFGAQKNLQKNLDALILAAQGTNINTKFAELDEIMSQVTFFLKLKVFLDQIQLTIGLKG